MRAVRLPRAGCGGGRDEGWAAEVSSDLTLGVQIETEGLGQVRVLLPQSSEEAAGPMEWTAQQWKGQRRRLMGGQYGRGREM